jgi:hypothetical protein
MPHVWDVIRWDGTRTLRMTAGSAAPAASPLCLESGSTLLILCAAVGIVFILLWRNSGRGRLTVEVSKSHAHTRARNL